MKFPQILSNSNLQFWIQLLQEADEGRRLLKEEYGKLGHDGARAPRTLHDFAESNYLTRLNFVRTSSKA